MKRSRGRATILSVFLAAAAWFVWHLAPWEPVLAVATLTDPAKLATLGSRGANPRLNKIVYWLDAGRRRGIPCETAIDLAQLYNRTENPRARLVKDSLLRNIRIADQLGLFTSDNRERMRNGRASVITKGPYANALIEVDHIVPYSLAKEAGNELANLEIMPAPLNRRKSNRVGERQLSHAQRLFNAGLLSAESLARVRRELRK